MEKPIMVSVIMLTFQHENYIKQAIEGVLMQQCNFKIELMIVNDCSSDKTAKIIQYIIQNDTRASIIKYHKHQKNIGANANLEFAINQTKSKYIAICEGDDYWTDPFKLQKQVDFLEDNSNIVVCGTTASTLTKNNELIPSGALLQQQVTYFTKAQIMRNNPFYTCTVVFKNSTIPTKLLRGFYAPDWALYVYLLKDGLGCVLDNNTAVYNYHCNGVASSLTHITYLHHRLKDRLLLIATNEKKYKKTIKKEGLRLIWNYVKQAVRFKKTFMRSLTTNRKVIINYILS
jgi:glycosyltransferase involved in cell wall biosynthesis